MGILTDVYIATSKDAANYDADPQSFRDVTLSAKGITDLELSTLWALFRGEAWNVESLKQFEHVLVRDGGERMVIGLPDALVTYLAESNEQNLSTVGTQWAATEEMVRYSQYVQDYLRRLAVLSKRARSENKSLYLWVCV